MPEQQCPTSKELVAFASGSLADSDSTVVAGHLDSCPRCVAAMETLDIAEDTVVSLLRSSATDDGFEHEDSCGLALERVRRLEELLVLEDRVSSQRLENVPEQIGQYRLAGKLGQGGIGSVYRAEHTSLHRTVALKLLHPSRLKDDVAIERFRREMKAVGQLDHPNIVQATDAGEADGHHYLVMNLVDGVNLSTLVRRHGSLRSADACELIRQAAVGLQHAHDHGFIHRDIKPSNLMLTVTALPANQDLSSRGAVDPTKKVALVKVLDLGMALLDDPHLREAQDLTSTGQVMGTVDYMSPEQYDSAHRVDVRSDIYSLGATLYKLLCGHAPFAKCKTLLEKMRAVAVSEIPSVAGFRRDLPDKLNAIVHRMLARDPAERFATASEVAKALEPFCHDSDLPALLTNGALVDTDHGVEATQPDGPGHPESAEPDKTQSMRRLSLGWHLLLLAFVGPLVLAAILIRIKHKDGTESTVQLDSRSVESITIEPSGRPTESPRAGVSSESGAERPSVLDHLDAITLPTGLPAQAGDPQLVAVLGDDRLNHWGPVISAAFSPDGSLVATGGYDRIIRVWNTRTGDEVHALHGHGGRIQTLAFSSDCTKLVSGGGLKKVIVWDVETGEKMYEWTPPAATLQLVTFDSDDEPLAVGKRPEGIIAWEVTTGQSRFSIAAELSQVSRFSLSEDGRTLAAVDEGRRELRVFDTESGELRFTAPAEMNLGTPAVFTPDGNRLAYLAGVDDETDDAKRNDHVAKKIVVCDAQTGKLIQTFDSESAATLTISPDGKLLAAGGAYQTQVWGIESGQEILSLDPHPAMVLAIAIDSQSGLVITGSYDGSVRLWSLQTGQESVERLGHRSALSCLAFSPDGNLLATGSLDRSVMVWDLDQRKSLAKLPEQPGAISAVWFGPNKHSLAVRSQSPLRSNKPGRLTLWDAATASLRMTWSSIPGVVADIDFDPDRPRVVTVQYDGTVDVVGLKSTVPRMTFPEPELDFSTAAFSPDGQSVVAGARTGEVLLWTVGSDEPSGRLMRHADQVTGFAFSQDGRYLVSAGLDDRVMVWDFVRKEVVKQIAGQAEGIVSLAVTADASRIAWASYGGHLRLWKRDIPQPQTLFQFDDGTRHPTNHRFPQLVFSPEGRYLATANQNGTVFIFRTDGSRLHLHEQTDRKTR